MTFNECMRRSYIYALMARDSLADGYEGEAKVYTDAARKWLAKATRTKRERKTVVDLWSHDLIVPDPPHNEYVI